VSKNKTKNVSTKGSGLDLETIRSMAEKCPELVACGFGCDLDYSVESLRCLDSVIDTLRNKAVDFKTNIANLVVLTCGCYAGEVLVRAFGGSWVFVPDEAREVVSFGWSVKLGRGFTNPISKAFERFREGDEHSLYVFAVVCKKICVDGVFAFG